MAPCRCPVPSWSIAAASRRWCPTFTTFPIRATATPATGSTAAALCASDQGNHASSASRRRRRWPPFSSSRSRARAAILYRRPASCPALRDLCDRHDILLVVDEVQSGMGRTGKMFAVEHWGVEPDIICLAKGIASGMPLGAILARDEVMDWPSGSHASTFGGNPVSCRAALATLDLLEGGYMANARERGEQLQEGLRELQKRHRTEIGEVRGLGLMVAMDPGQRRRPEPRPDRARRRRAGCLPAGFVAAGLRRERHPFLSAPVHHGRASRHRPAHSRQCAVNIAQAGSRGRLSGPTWRQVFTRPADSRPAREESDASANRHGRPVNHRLTRSHPTPRPGWASSCIASRSIPRVSC